MTHIALRKIELATGLTDVERQALLSAIEQIAQFDPGENISTEGDKPDVASVLLEGLACRSKVLQDGSRQIMSFHIAGDWVDLHSYFIQTMDHSVTAMSHCRVGLLPHSRVRRLIETYPRLAAFLWRETMIDSAIFREWVVNIGARDAYTRIAHLFCEIYTRLKVMGLADKDGFELPLTQTDLADAIGVSTVHVNRVLQQLRGEGLIDYARGRLTIHDEEALKQVGDFEPTYLHLHEGPPTAPVTIVA